MDLANKLKEQGWYLTDDGIKKVAAASTASDVRKIIATAMDMDFREIAAGALPTKRDDTIPGRIVLQIQKIRNISAPKANEESKVAPRFLQLDLSDGQTTLQALELESIAALSLNLPPGTKLYFRADRLQLMQGFLILRGADLQVLGGRVEALVEKWELARTMQKYARSGRRMSGTGGPPPWIAFGKKLDALKDGLPTDRKFNSLLAASDKDKESKENEEFNAMRSEAIAEATKAGAKKVFGGGGQQILDHNVKKILEKGYSSDEAKQALRSTNNNLERALYNLKRRQEYKRYDEAPVKTTQVNAAITSTKSIGRGALSAKEPMGKRGMASAKEEAAAAKPAANVSLFDFLTDKLPANSNATSTSTTTAAHTQQSGSSSSAAYAKTDATRSSSYSSNNANTSKSQESAARAMKFENNISSSFAANRSVGVPRNSGNDNSGGTRRNDGERNESSRRDTYNANERGMNNRYTSRGGGNSRGGRGGGRTSYEDNRNRESERNAPNTSAPRNTNNYNAGGNRSNRASYERSANTNTTTAASTQNDNDRASSNGQQENTRSGGGGGGGYNNRRGGGNDGSARGERYERYQPRENNHTRQQSNNYNNNNTNNNAMPPATANASNNNSSSSSSKNDSTTRVNKLIESTSKMRIDNKSREQQQQPNRSQQQQQPQQQQPQQQQQQYSQSQKSHYATTAPNASYVSAGASTTNQNTFQQMPNGFTYDPSKIIGFQNKETNDFAMTLLKSQGLAATATSSAQQQQQQQIQQAAVAVSPTAQQIANTYMPIQAQQAHPPAAVSPYAMPAAYVLPAGAAVPAAAVTSQYGMIPADGWMWKIGDLCLAKYWDDGRYYEAEITAISDKTCVVFFLGYGNHEEVLKTDCLPITDVNNRPINNYVQQQQQLQAANAMQTQHQFQRGGTVGGGGAGGGGGSQRYRSERPMYVPPHKREN